MHETALAEAVVATALETAEKEGLAEIRTLVVRIGELQKIDKGVLEFALKEVMPLSEPRLASMSLTLETEPARFECRPCKHRFGLNDVPELRSEDESEAIHFIPELAHVFLRCPECDSPDFEVLQGRGVTIETLE